MLQEQAHRGPDSAGSGVARFTESILDWGFAASKSSTCQMQQTNPWFPKMGDSFLFTTARSITTVELRTQLDCLRRSSPNQRGYRGSVAGVDPVGALPLFPGLTGCGLLCYLIKFSGEILLSRDRFGIKPLYTHSDERGVVRILGDQSHSRSRRQKISSKHECRECVFTQNLLCTGRKTFLSGNEEFPAGSLARLSLEDIGKKRS